MTIYLTIVHQIEKSLLNNLIDSGYKYEYARVSRLVRISRAKNFRLFDDMYQIGGGSTRIEIQKDNVIRFSVED